MKSCLPFLVKFILCFTAFDVVGQINIDYPLTRSVFQRDKSNFAPIYIAGSYTKSIDRVEAKLIALNHGNSTEWTTIHTNPQGGFYSGNITASGGWYEIQVRGIKDEQQISFHALSPVGVGEVFLIAGQSNAQGFSYTSNNEFGVQGASDDRVNCINYSNHDKQNPDLPYPAFGHLDAPSNISPRGQSAWNWGKLGDLLASRLQVPILFYNAAWDGTIVRSWRESITGTAVSPYIPANYEPSGMPYSNMRTALQQYVAMTGVRGVLWLQGEGDNQFNTTTDSYFADLKAIIDASRNDSGKNISWMIALTSYSNKFSFNNNVIEGQKRVINTVSNVFEGPNSDAIQVPRTDKDGIHFHGDGLLNIAEAWNNKLTDDFFARSSPVQGLSPIQVSVNCGGDNSVTLTINNDDYSNVRWNNGQNSNSVRVGNGTYSVSARDKNGNMIFSPVLRITEAITPPQPTVTLQGSNPVCIGNTAILISNISENIRWNTGSTGNHLPVTSGGEYFVTTKSVYGCETSSARTAVSVLNAPLPERPTVSASGAATFCDGGEVSLRSNSNLTHFWSNGATGNSITVRVSGDFRVKVVDNLGCYSPESEPVSVRVNPLPRKPDISASGNTTFCAGSNVSLTSNYDNGNIWSNAAVSKTITIETSGTYTLKQRDSNGCESTSDPVNIRVNPLPQTPVVTALRPTTFCMNDYTTLRGSDARTYVWSDGSGSREIVIRHPGNYSLAVIDENQCISPWSPAVQVVVNPLPPTPVITADGPTVFCADLSVNLRSTPAAEFLWNNGATGQTIKVTQANTYIVQTINEFKCYSAPSNPITVNTLALPPAPTVQALTRTTFCDGDFVALKANGGNRYIWNNGTEKDTIHATASGQYSARVKDANGCFSPYSGGIGVDVKDTPTTPVISQTGVFTLSAQNNLNTGNYIWKLNGANLTESGAIIKAVKSGSYIVNNSVTYSATLTCISGNSAPFSFLADTRNNGLVAYPNPLYGEKLILETVQDINNAVVDVINAKGVIHKTYKIRKIDRQQFFNISDLPAGQYIIRVVSDSFVASQKVTVIK
jgi:hypothetical protein